jgi:hypothetical protein
MEPEPSTKSEASAVGEMILGGRYLVTNIKEICGVCLLKELQ